MAAEVKNPQRNLPLAVMSTISIVTVLYVLAAINFGLKARIPLKNLLFYILAGTLPIASLIVERRVARRYS